MTLANAVLLSIIFIGISYMVFCDLRYTLRKRASENWPSVEATIDNGVVGFRGPLSALPRILYRVHFTYSYRVNDSQRTGYFYLLTQGRERGATLQRELAGKRVLVRYDNRRPEISFVSEPRILGKRVMQGPSWTYR